MVWWCHSFANHGNVESCLPDLVSKSESQWLFRMTGSSCEIFGLQGTLVNPTSKKVRLARAPVHECVKSKNNGKKGRQVKCAADGRFQSARFASWPWSKDASNFTMGSIRREQKQKSSHQKSIVRVCCCSRGRAQQYDDSIQPPAPLQMSWPRLYANCSESNPTTNRTI